MITPKIAFNILIMCIMLKHIKTHINDFNDDIINKYCNLLDVCNKNIGSLLK